MKKLPIWLEDLNGNKYHVKLDSKGIGYIVDAGLHKSLRLMNIEKSPVGTVIEYPFFYNTYRVIRNDLLGTD